MIEELTSTNLPLTDRLDTTIVGKLTADEWAELLHVVKAAMPRKAGQSPKMMARQAEFPMEEAEQLRDDIQRDTANNEQRVAERNANPPTPEQLEQLLPQLDQRIREAVQDYIDNCGHLKVKLKRSDE